MARQKQKKWRVYFDLNAPREDRRRKRRPGRELPIHQTFSWGGTEWRIPAVYVCAQGLVADFVRRVPAGSIQTFTGRWKLRPDEDRYDFTREERTPSIWRTVQRGTAPAGCTNLPSVNRSRPCRRRSVSSAQSRTSRKKPKSESSALPTGPQPSLWLRRRRKPELKCAAMYLPSILNCPKRWSG